LAQNNSELVDRNENDARSLGGAAVAENAKQSPKSVQASSIDLDNIIMSVERTTIGQARIDNNFSSTF